MAQRIERPGLDQRLQGPLVEDPDVHPFDEVGEIDEGTLLTGFEDPFHHPFAHVADRREAESDRPLVDREIHPRGVDVGNEHFDAHRPAFVEVQGRAVFVPFRRRQ